MLSQLVKFAHEMEDVLIKKKRGLAEYFFHLFPCVKIKAAFLQAFCPISFFFFVPLVWIFFPSRLGFVFFFSLNGGIQSLNEINTCKNAF